MSRGYSAGSARVSHCGGFLSCGAQTQELVLGGFSSDREIRSPRTLNSPAARGGRPRPRGQKERAVLTRFRGGGARHGADVDWPLEGLEPDPSKWGLAWAGTKKRTRETGARARALRRLVERAGEARGTCRREPREWRAGDVSAPCPLRHLAPSLPAHCFGFGIFYSNPTGSAPFLPFLSHRRRPFRSRSAGRRRPIG